MPSLPDSLKLWVKGNAAHLVVALGDDVVEGLGDTQELKHAGVKAGEDGVALAAAGGRVQSGLLPVRTEDSRLDLPTTSANIQALRQGYRTKGLLPYSLLGFLLVWAASISRDPCTASSKGGLQVGKHSYQAAGCARPSVGRGSHPLPLPFWLPLPYVLK